MALNKLKNYSQGSTAVLLKGTILSQAITVLASPVLTRIFSPAQFGDFAIYSSISAILAVVFSGRYELAILAANDDSEAQGIAKVSFYFSLISLILCYILYMLAQIFGDFPDLPWFVLIIPIGAFLMSLYQTLYIYINRERGYARLSKSKIIMSLSTVLFQVAFGSILTSSIDSGLIFGLIIGQVLALIPLYFSYRQSDLKSHTFSEISNISKKYINYPKFLIAAHTLNASAVQLPSAILGSIFNAHSGGIYNIVQRVLGLPSSLISSAIGDVFRQRASHNYNLGISNRPIYLSTLSKLTFIGAPAFSILFFAAPIIFPVIFGPQWKDAGIYAQILTPMFLIRFISAPLSAMYMIAQKQQVDLIWQIIFILSLLISVYVGKLYNSVFTFLYCLSFLYSTLYLFNIAISFSLASKKGVT